MSGSDSKKSGFRDDPDALSMHTTNGEAAYTDAVDDDDAAPPYTPFDSGTIRPPPPTGPQFRNPDGDDEEIPYFTGVTEPESHFAFTSYRIGNKRTRIGNEVIHLQDQRSDADPQFLETWINMMSALPPSPYIHIVGTHKETKRDKDGKKRREDVTDFRIMVSLRNYLWPNFNPDGPNEMKLLTAEGGKKTYRGTILKKRAPGAKGDIEVGHAKPTLKEWYHRYCANGTGTKVFRLTRTVTGMDKEQLRSRLTGLIRSTNYKGKLTIEFPVADRAVDIYSSSRLNTWRLTTWICWMFYLTFLWIFAWPVLFFTTKKYHVVRAEWPFAQVNEQGQKRYTTVSEEQWTSRYGPAIKQLCLDRYDGLAGDDYLNEVLDRAESQQNNQPQIDTRAALGVAAAAFQGGRFNAARGASSLMRFVGGQNDQVGWGFDT
ncbi:hypothetical protein CEP51_008788 [Fusarium floridanum]|uniref:Uncharacterized protein n=1 Tax=Fusarium floridanum TaxID=1325733 RepID=A0A428RJQ3_9HYPO|nr:hypothetical protein CEP51_008788 [Fusarium floridanum]